MQSGALTALLEKWEKREVSKDTIRLFSPETQKRLYSCGIWGPRFHPALSPTSVWFRRWLPATNGVERVQSQVPRPAPRPNLLDLQTGFLGTIGS